MRRLILSRHANAEGDRLTELGISQAMARGSELRGAFNIDLLLHSPRKRAEVTGKIIAMVCNKLAKPFGDATGSGRKFEFQKAAWLETDKIATREVPLADAVQAIKSIEDRHQTVCLTGHADDMPMIMGVFNPLMRSAVTYNARPVVLEFDTDSWQTISKGNLTASHPCSTSVNQRAISEQTMMMRSLETLG